ncbi:glycosyltransferase [Xenorhabdus cabanillasii]|uniref:Glycosyl transferase, group 1 n=1 Tax=Xenorhabdus cabanillasii JM26 TaxID=1427517 RepID=W1J151_9GAMM|nr:glycosyltransferase [Xenorhabdus cabanillasii]PHM77693.1 putative UDP-galactose--lipooligosaccharide galactosyltransferase [Xenorhabdus cabanillasii JM26]CDL84457.1 putative Glycosyl transferase, group 1 [Xenorhabdus cabanillasii JM26]
MKSIFFITSSYPFGDGESFITSEIEDLSDNYKVHVIPTYPRGNLKNNQEKKTNKNIYYLYLPLLTIKYFFSSLLFIIKHPIILWGLLRLCLVRNYKHSIRNLVLIPKSIFLYKKMKKINPCFIYSHWISAPTQLAMMLSFLSKVPYGATGHRWDVIDNNNFTNKFENATFVRLISKKSQQLLHFKISKKYHDKIKTIYIGVDVDKNTNISFIKSHTRGVCIANLIPVKGHIYLFNAISLLKRKDNIVHIDIIGDGELKEYLLKLAKNLNIEQQIHFKGQLTHNCVQNLLDRGIYQFCCLPSLDLGNGLHEGIPVSLMEAMSKGIPCISTTTGSITELINDSYNGILVKAADSEALANGIMVLIQDKDLRQKISENGIKTINYLFNRKNNNKKILDLINKHRL